MAQTEQWYWIDRSGQLLEHTEYDGVTALRRGCCPQDRPVQIDRLSEQQARDLIRRLIGLAHRLQQERAAQQQGGPQQ